MKININNTDEEMFLFDTKTMHLAEPNFVKKKHA